MKEIERIIANNPLMKGFADLNCSVNREILQVELAKDIEQYVIKVREQNSVFLCSVCQQSVDNYHNEKICLEIICEKVHKAYCQYCLDVKGEEYWTKGDYSKLTEEVKEADRYTVRAVLAGLKKGLKL